MSLIVAARFDTFEQAGGATDRLRAAGFDAQDVSSFFVNPAGQHSRYHLGGDADVNPGTRRAHRGAIAGALAGLVAGGVLGVLLVVLTALPGLVAAGLALVGAYVGSLAGAMNLTRGTQAGPAREGRPAGVLVAVQVTPLNQSRATGLLRAAGGHDLEQAQGEWRDGQWVDFDPARPPATGG